MKKAFILALAAALLLVSSCALAVTIEPVEPVRIHGDFVLTDYGFGIQDDNGSLMRQYGFPLDESEERDAEGYTPCYYFTIKNEGQYGETVSIYVRGGSKYDRYWKWNDAYIGPGESTTFYGSGYDKIAGNRGNWNVELNNKWRVKFKLAR